MRKYIPDINPRVTNHHTRLEALSARDYKYIAHLIHEAKFEKKMSLFSGLMRFIGEKMFSTDLGIKSQNSKS